MEKVSTNNGDVFRSSSALFMICFFGSFLPVFLFPLLSFFPRASSSCLLLKRFFFIFYIHWAASVPPMLCSLFSSLAPDVRSFFFPLLAFTLSCCLLFIPHILLSSFRSFLRFLFYVVSFPVFRSSFLSFVLSASSHSVHFFVWVKPSCKASVWDALQYLLCEKPAWHAETMSFFLLSFLFLRLLHAFHVGFEFGWFPNVTSCQYCVSKQDHKREETTLMNSTTPDHETHVVAAGG